MIEKIPRIVFPLRHPQHGVHADVHLTDAGEGVVAGRSNADAAGGHPAISQLAGVAESEVDIPEIRRDRLARVRQNGIGLE